MRHSFSDRCLFTLILVQSYFTSMTYSQTKYFEYSKDLRIHYKKSGIGKMNLVLLHGFGASIETWDDLKLTLDTINYCIHEIDLKGFGLSSKPKDKDYSMDEQAKIVHRYITENSLENVTLIGHSYGGGVVLLTAIKLIEENKNILKHLVLIDCAAYSDQIPFFIKYLRTPILNKIIFLTNKSYRARFVLNRLFFDKSKITKKILNRYVNSFTPIGTKHSFVKAAKQIIPEQYQKTISKYSQINIPTLIIWGRQDAAISLENGEKLNKQIIGSVLRIIDNCGHIPQEEMPDTTNELIVNFINN